MPKREAIRETTVWEGISKAPNHIYLVEGTKAIAYIPWGNSKPIWFKHPMMLDKRRRTFVAANTKLFG